MIHVKISVLEDRTIEINQSKTEQRLKSFNSLRDLWYNSKIKCLQHMYLDPRLKRKNGTTMIYKQTISEEVHCNLTSTNTKKKKKQIEV